MEFAIQLFAWLDCCEVFPQQPYLVANCVCHRLNFLVIVLCRVERKLLVGGFELASHCCHCLSPLWAAGTLGPLSFGILPTVPFTLGCCLVSAKNGVMRLGLM